jgi:nucleotide-binding universal stress UspA family protein
MYRNILVPVDGSPFGEAALPLALSLARRSGAVLHLVHVMPPIGTIYSEAPLYIDSSLEQELFEHQRERNQAYLDGLARKLGARASVVVKTALLAGDIPLLLRTHAIDTHADVVVMTTHARGPLGRFWLGSVADDLVRKLPMPLLLVRPGEKVTEFEPEPAPRHILVPLDGEPMAEQMLERAVEVGTLMEADYTLLRVIRPVLPTPYTAEGASMAQIAQSLIEETNKIQEQIAKEAREYLEKVAGGLRQRGLKVNTRVVVEEGVALAILHQAQSTDLIALCTHGRRGLTRLFLGSVADKVIRGGHLPVLVFRPIEVKK